MQTRSALFALSVAACGGSTKPAPASRPAPASTQQGSAAAEESGPPGDSHEAMTSITSGALDWTPLDGGAVMVATVWGERTSPPSGRFVKYAAGHVASSLDPHGDQHAIVVAGTLTLAESVRGSATPVGPGSYWSQPAGKPVNLTCGKDAACLVYVHTSPKTGTADARHVVTRASDVTWAPLDPATPTLGRRALLWGDDATASGMLVRMPPGSPEHWHVHKAPYHAVVLAGTVANVESGAQPTELPTGAYWSQPGGYKHSETCKAGGPECLVYVHHAGAYLMKPM